MPAASANFDAVFAGFSSDARGRDLQMRPAMDEQDTHRLDVGSTAARKVPETCSEGITSELCQPSCLARGTLAKMAHCGCKISCRRMHQIFLIERDAGEFGHVLSENGVTKAFDLRERGGCKRKLLTSVVFTDFVF